MADEMKGVRRRVADALAQSIAVNYCKAAGFHQVHVRAESELVDFPNIQPVDQPSAPDSPPQLNQEP